MLLLLLLLLPLPPPPPPAAAAGRRKGGRGGSRSSSSRRRGRGGGSRRSRSRSRSRKRRICSCNSSSRSVCRRGTCRHSLATTCTNGRGFPVVTVFDVCRRDFFSPFGTQHCSMAAARMRTTSAAGVYALPHANALGRLQCMAELFQ